MAEAALRQGQENQEVLDGALRRPIEIFTATDAMSESVLAAALQLGLSVPDDILITVQRCLQ
jgi:DNA-binding LacI/PurR family transcriptional regulator